MTASATPYFDLAIRRIRYERAAQDFMTALQHTARVLRKYADAQPRAPAGTPEGGQWVSQDSLAAAVQQTLDAVGNALSQLLAAGGFSDEDMGKTVQDFVAEKCRASIYSVLPGQYIDWTLEELLQANKDHTRAAQRCIKILKQERFRK